MPDTIVTEWLNALGYTGAGKALITHVSEVGRRPYAAELRDLLDHEGVYQLDAVFVIENTPTVCIIDGSRLTEKTHIDRLRQRLWNQNLASALLVLGESELKAFSVPRWKESETQALALDNATVDGNWSASEFESSSVQRRLSDWFDPNRRVDRDLLRQLSAAVSQMTAGDNAAISSQLIAQMVMAQVLFISYLEHRSIIGSEYQAAHGLRPFHTLIKENDTSGIDKLLVQLKSDFNGDFLHPRQISWKRLDRRVLSVVNRFLSRVDLETGQLDFWNYDFSQIPVELLSGIYETFLQDKTKIDGAYYTPRVLAELAVEQAFDGIANLSAITVFDGACGSGILLTTAFRKIVAYQEAIIGGEIDISGRIVLLRRTIFGGDINKIACRVTAFSLYLCLLERLSPSDLLALQNDEGCKLPKLININISEGKVRGDFFSSHNPFAHSRRFDVVISNPPWRELKGDEGVNAKLWASRHKVRMPHKQIAAAFAAKMTECATEAGRIVAILPSSLITAPTNADFLRQMVVRVTIERIINLADFRRLLFARAEHACTLMVASRIEPLVDGKLKGSFQYWMPKVDISFAFNRLTLHDYDAVTMSRAALVKDNGILRRRSWGSSRDDALVARLTQLSNLKETKIKREWVTAKGYHMTDGDKQADVSALKDMLFLPTSALNSPSPVADTSLLEEFPLERGMASAGDIRMYTGPRVIWPDGTTVEIEIRAAFTDVDFCFNSAVGGIAFPQQDRQVAKFVSCYLRSSLAKYWLILNGYSASTERARVSLAEVMSLPFIEPESHPNKENIENILSIASSKIQEFENLIGTALAESNYEIARDGVDEIVFDYFNLSSHERSLVIDMVDLAAKSLQPTSYDELFTPLQGEITPAQSQAFVKQLDEALSTWSINRKGSGSLSVRVLDRNKSKTPLDVIHVNLNPARADNNRSDGVETARQLIALLEKKLKNGHELNFFAIPNSVFIIGDDVYIVKPARIRFWSKSAALRDADELVTFMADNFGIHTNPDSEIVESSNLGPVIH